MSSIRCLRTRTSLLPLTAFVLMAGLLAASAYGGIARAEDSATPSKTPSPEEYWKTMDMDPDNGKTYSCFIEVLDNGRHLKVRGYLGLALLGRTQYWESTKKPD